MKSEAFPSSPPTSPDGGSREVQQHSSAESTPIGGDGASILPFGHELMTLLQHDAEQHRTASDAPDTFSWSDKYQTKVPDDKGASSD